MCYWFYSYPTRDYYVSLSETICNSNIPYSLYDMKCVLGTPNRTDKTNYLYNAYYWDHIILYTEKNRTNGIEYVTEVELIN